jgi:hypothetical protein
MKDFMAAVTDTKEVRCCYFTLVCCIITVGGSSAPTYNIACSNEQQQQL